ncbi:SAM-dependent methyltransferase [Hydrogenovibrio crunogenus]|uniref:SAM-dependent methyltransferase n=1 Tax=Hydrogenovibrio crunogenus TaxID=39765 RepID=A0A4V1C919_9GAMM|nr:SAM-dependent methyltransferase [Hydrogenovibrio crunogenus]QBZ83864.1 SAM-dependent methyltransferase [Hydrogenovibrio crunogenus]
MKPNQQLPSPSEEAQQKSLSLQQKIRQMLKRHGMMPFPRFMEMALYTPGLGYYASGLPKIGQQGDFITAPEVSSIFSRCLARQAAQVLETLDTPNVIEFGAGKGTMAKDILRELDALEQPIEQYYIVELSADLRARQQETLQTLPETLFNKVVWLDQLPKDSLQAVVLANEVLDAMPVERLRLEEDQSLRGYVTFNEDKQRFEWDYHPITDATLQKASNAILNLIGTPSPRGYETEINLNIHPWLQSIADFLSQGAVLLIDYGYSRKEYYQPSRHMGTLRCHYQHRAHGDPFFFPGLQDITAHVDFTSVAESGFDTGFKVAGYTTQAHFLMGSGLLEMSGDPTADITESLKIAQQIKTLTLPDEMGESFKVIALTKDVDLSLIGFKLRDLRHQL